ncbi:L-fuculose kinase [Massilia sp. Root351]|jgi:sugar (pentulose or hexulose) kinase|uniref:FGGY-family carbohydrate kinase n=1 Tax=Massilia sp. Root351 TaxID=1736522 RepID=UPI00070D6E57|nr:FGGY family carbohydrate kinase [Massilia sp. Root351]KQV82431.1 L-fuculose kinase [Massilia sp. Root351]
MTQSNPATIVLDIGKTNVKLALIDGGGRTLAEQRSPNAIVMDGLYPHHDTERIWTWMLDAMRAFAQLAQVAAIVPVTHGATAALVDDDGLVLPVLDYEFGLPPSQDAAYRALRPSYASSYSPLLPAGLNLGRQLAWQAHAYPEQFARARHILMYPQYWAWRLSGVPASEVTSLGCHTDLWQPARQQYSALVERMGWSGLFPALQPAWAPLGALKRELAAQTGLPADCQVICGIHDSNASLLRHLNGAGPRTVLSTGTWVIAAAIGMPLDGLREADDMLANSNALGEPVACMRFMGGREFAELAGPAPEPCSVDDLQRLISQGSMALPCFAAAGGPFGGRAGAIAGPAPQTAQERYALATLYCVLMSDYCLSALNAAQGDVVVEGSYTGNPHFAPLLAALRPGQAVGCSDDASGTTCGAWMLAHWTAAGRDGDGVIGTGSTPPAAAKALTLDGWTEYRARWLAAL